MIACDTITDVNLDEIVENHILSEAALTAVLKEDKISEETSKVINPSSLAVIQKKREYFNNFHLSTHIYQTLFIS